MLPDKGHIDTGIQDELQRLPSIRLEEMDSIKLMNRVDTKYLTNETVLLQLLAAAREAGYRALEIDGQKITPYNSLYYDTPDLKMYSDHHNRRLFRQKVRTRMYVNSGETYLEIKLKNNKGRTKKKRRMIDPSLFQDFRANEEAAAYLAGHSAYTSMDLSPQMETCFQRITLVNADKTERLTIDTGLSFVNHVTGLEATLPEAVIIELKQDGRISSPMKRIFLRYRVKPFRVSKYCIGMTLTRPGIKCNRFKLKIRRIEKTTHHKIIVR
ncbi:MAG: polyphosphate polymerase domain-containing protein [Bacteroidales bacterium]|nr:polyphosphate polymerase domain-containing protein [Bacteroidales bacterium]